MRGRSRSRGSRPARLMYATSWEGRGRGRVRITLSALRFARCYAGRDFSHFTPSCLTCFCHHLICPQLANPLVGGGSERGRRVSKAGVGGGASGVGARVRDRLWRGGRGRRASDGQDSQDVNTKHSLLTTLSRAGDSPTSDFLFCFCTQRVSPPRGGGDVMTQSPPSASPQRNRREGGRCAPQPRSVEWNARAWVGARSECEMEC